MSTSLLYHAFGLVGYHYVNQTFEGGEVTFRIEQPREVPVHSGLALQVKETASTAAAINRRGRLQGTRCLEKNRNAGPVKCNSWFAGPPYYFWRVTIGLENVRLLTLIARNSENDNVISTKRLSSFSPGTTGQR